MAPAVRDGYAGSEWDAEPDLAALVRGRRARLLLGAAGGVLAVVVVVAVLLSSSGMRGPRDDAGAPPGGPEAVGADAGDAHDGGAAEPAGADLPSPADASPAVAPAEALPLADVASPAEPTAAPDAPLADGTGTDAGAPGTRPAGDVGSGAPSAGADRGSAGEQRSPPQARTPEGLVAARLVRIRGSLARCFDGSIDRYFAVTVTVGGSDGRVRGTSVTGDLYPATVRCIRGLIESLAFPPFPREEVTVRQAYAPDGQP